MKNFNYAKSQNLSHLHFNTFRKASPEAMDALLNADTDEAIAPKKISILESAHRGPAHAGNSFAHRIH